MGILCALRRVGWVLELGTRLVLLRNAQTVCKGLRNPLLRWFPLQYAPVPVAISPIPHAALERWVCAGLWVLRLYCWFELVG